MLRLALFQTDIAWCRPERNLARLEPLIAATDADVAVLPEMFATGFGVDAGAAAEPLDGPVAAAMRGWARRYDRAVTGSVAVRDGEGCYNRMYFATPDGGLTWYDKRHLFAPGGEAAAFAAGCERCVVTFRGVRFLLLVCYDLRFPVWIRNRGDYDAILCCASWPASRRDVWRTLLRARAIENQCYVAGVNRVGSDPAAHYAGDSAVIDFRGRTLSEAGGGERTLTVDLDLEALEDFRNGFPVWRDADEFHLLK